MSQVLTPLKRIQIRHLRGPAATEQRRQVGVTIGPHYDAGKSIRTLCDETGLSYGFVYNALCAAKVVRRAKGGTRKSVRTLR
ncbi:helix-turn-helix domain-containing protein [Streptomyces noursei]